MGCGSSSLDLVVDQHRPTTDDEDADGSMNTLITQIKANPWLMSKDTSISPTGGTALHVACEHKMMQAVEAMLSFLTSSPLSVVREALGPHCKRSRRDLPATNAEGLQLAVNMLNGKGQTPLMLACTSGSPQLVRLLLAQGADPWVGDHCGGRAALHYAAMAGHAECVEALLDNLTPQQEAREGVRYINVRNQCGLSALHYAVFFDRPAAVEELLRHDPNLNATTHGNSYDVMATCDALCTPLHFAALRGSVAVARLLLQHYAVHSLSWGSTHTADLRSRRNDERKTPWQVASANHPHYRELLELLHPSAPLERLLGLGGGATAASSLCRGALPLANLAAAALSAKLLADLAGIRAAPQGSNQVREPEAETRGSSRGCCATAQGSRGGQRPEGPGATTPCMAATRQASSSLRQHHHHHHYQDGGDAQKRVPPSAQEAAARPNPDVLVVPAEGSSTHSGALVRRSVIASSASGSLARKTPGLVRPTGQTGGGQAGAINRGSIGSEAFCRVGPASAARACEGEGEDEGLCGVCLSGREEVAAAGCGHTVCWQCAERMVRGMMAVHRPRPLLCPFCRREVAGFVVAGGQRGSRRTAT